MSKDPAFLFYPGDYLRDTQCLSEAVQVSYDRIMCEHMRNICISQQQLKFFTKRLTEEEKEELLLVLTEINPGSYQIKWVAESIEKRRKYSESRRNNRKGKTKDKDNNTSKSYVNHMDNESEIDNVDLDKEEVTTTNRGAQFFKKPQDVKSTLLSQTTWKHTVLRKLRALKLDCTQEELDKWINIFALHVATTNEWDVTLSRVQSHFSNWVPKQIKNNPKAISKTAVSKSSSSIAQELIEEQNEESKGG